MITPREKGKVAVVLQDILEEDLRVVFCGTAVGPKSAEVGAYYAGPGNKFWSILFVTRLTPHTLDPHEFRTLTKFGIGLTDVVKSQAGTDRRISRATEDDIANLRAKIEEHAPKAVAFNGKKAATWFYNIKSTSLVDYGRQPERIGRTTVFVLPSTSATSGHWDESPWHELAEFLRASEET